MNHLRNMHALKHEALERAGHRCQGAPEYPTCRAKDGQAHPVTDKPVRLSLIHLTPGDDSPNNVRVWCERCVLSYDWPAHVTHDWRSRRKAKMNHELFPIDEPGKPT